MDQEEGRQALLGYLFLVPSLAVFAVFMFYPLFYTVYLSFFEWDMVKPMKRSMGLANYTTIFKDPDSWKITSGTVVYILVLLVLNFVPPYILSFILSAMIKRRKGFHKTVFPLSSVTSLMMGSILYIWVLNPISGPVALVLRYFGLALPLWSKVEGWVITVLSVITSWKVFGCNFAIVLAGVSGISTGIIEVARLDSILLRKILRDMVVPASSATGIYVFIITIVQGPQYVFIPTKVVTQGGPNYASSSLIHMSYHETFTLYRTGTSLTVSVTIMALFVVLLLMKSRFVEKRVYYES